MVNKRQKGKRREREARDMLEEKGYLTETKNYSRWGSEDFWELFDILAIKGPEVRLIQVKTNRSDFYKARKKISKWVEKNNIKLDCEVWLRENYSDWRCEVCNEA